MKPQQSNKPVKLDYYNIVTSITDYVSISVVLDGRVRPIAVAEANRIDNDWVICRVYVRPGYRTKGFGSLVLKRLIEKIKSIGGECVWVSPNGYGYDPKLQIRFYRKHGFKKQRNADAGYGSYKLTFKNAEAI